MNNEAMNGLKRVRKKRDAFHYSWKLKSYFYRWDFN